MKSISKQISNNDYRLEDRRISQDSCTHEDGLLNAYSHAVISTAEKVRYILCGISLFFITMLLIFPASNSFAFSMKGQDCYKCHTLRKEEASALLEDLIPNAKILNVSMIPVKGLWEVDLESNNRKGMVYISFSKKYLFSGAIIEIKGKKNLTQERLTEINRVNVSQIPLKDALIIGDKNAKNRIIVFTDPECPFCAKIHQEMKKVIKERKDIAFYIKMFPLKMHAGAYDKAKTIVCEKSLSLLENAYEKKVLPKPKCKTTVVDENIKLAEKLGISGIPALIMPDGRVITGYRDADALKELIDKR
jgi:thiol:disulfide interchange protein DsbC